MNDTLKVIVNLLDSGKPELQVAAAQILGELHSKEPAVGRALAGAIRRSPVLGRFCLDALAKIGNAESLAKIAEVLLDFEALADHAAHILGDLGTPAHAVIAKLYPQAVGDQHERILGILSRSLSKDAIDVFVHGLLTPETTAGAGEMLRAASSQFVPPLQKHLREGLARHLDSALPEDCLAQVVAVLAAVDPVGSRQHLLRFTQPGTTPVVRSAAFRALQGSKLTAAQVRGMMDLLEDAAEKEVHDAVREVLAQLPEVPQGLLPVLKRLISSRQPEQRLFALRMLRTAGGGELAKVSIKLLSHDDPRFQKAAEELLAHNKQAVEPLVRVVLTTKDPALAKVAVGILMRLGGYITPKTLRALGEKAVKLLATNARTGDLLLDVVLAAGGNKVGAMLVERAVRMRRAKRTADALHLLARLVASPHGDDESRYQLALTKLRQDMALPAAEATAPGNSTMGFFAALVRSGFPLVERLRKEASVRPEAMLLIATHFSEAVGVERRFGTDLLKHLAQRTKGRAGDEARVVLRAVGG
ncbi:MAG: hypothetical protein ABIP94_01545 [Planctomycetota bacterium]